MNRKEKLLVDMWVFLLSGIVCLAVLVCTVHQWNWRDFLGVLAWPCLDWVYGEPVFTWAGSPWFWRALAAVLLWLFARQFWTSGRRAVWLGAAAVAVWWLAGLFLVWGCFVAEC
jgi:hypothetical protein